MTDEKLPEFIANFSEHWIIWELPNGYEIYDMKHGYLIQLRKKDNRTIGEKLRDLEKKVKGS